MDFLDRLKPGTRAREQGRTGRYDVILIQGAPGAGKSTLAANLKRHFPDGASIEVDAVRGMINQVEWIHEAQGLHSIESAWSAGLSYLSNGYYPLILVNAFGPTKYKKIISLIRASRPAFSYHTLVLYCSDEELVSRIASRKKGFSDTGNSLLHNRYIRTCRHRNESVIDTTERSPESVLEEALRILM